MNSIESVEAFEKNKLAKLEKWGLTPADIEQNKESVKKVSSKEATELGEKMLSIIRKKNYNEDSSDFDEVMQLIKDGADVNYKSNDKKGFTGLIFSARNGFMKTFITLLKFGADVNLSNNFGTTALMSASVHNYFEMVDMLIILDADVNARCKDGDNPLICAKKYSSKESYDLLIKANAQIGQKNICNKTSVDYPSDTIDDLQYVIKENLNPIHIAMYEDVLYLLEKAQESLNQISKGVAIKKEIPQKHKTGSFKRIS